MGMKYHSWYGNADFKLVWERNTTAGMGMKITVGMGMEITSDMGMEITSDMGMEIIAGMGMEITAGMARGEMEIADLQVGL